MRASLNVIISQTHAQVRRHRTKIRVESTTNLKKCVGNECQRKR